MSERSKFIPESEINSNGDKRENNELYYFNESEKAIVKKCLDIFYQNYKDTKPQDMPATVLIMETSGRPILYAILPVIKKLYKDKGLKIPNFEFVPVSRVAADFAYKARAEFPDDDDYLEKYLDYNVELHEDDSNFALSLSDIFYKKALTVLQNREDLSKYLDILIKNNRIDFTKPILLIDDYMQILRKRTFREVYESINTIRPDCNIEAFAFLNSLMPEAYSSYYTDNEAMKITAYLDTKSNFKLIKGLDDPKAGIESEYDQYGSKGFDYRHKNLSDSEKNEVGAKSSRVGVEKKGTTIKKTLNLNSEEVFKLREEMRNVGEDYVKLLI